MTANLGAADRVIRLVAGLVLLLVALFAGLGPASAWAAGLVGVVLIATAALRFCPAYRLIGVNTCRI